VINNGSERRLPFLKNLRVCYASVCHVRVNTAASMPRWPLCMTTHKHTHQTRQLQTSLLHTLFNHSRF